MKKIDNRKIDFYVINYFYKCFFLFFTGECNFTPYKKHGTGGCQPVPTMNGKKKSFKQKLFKIKFCTEKSANANTYD